MPVSPLQLSQKRPRTDLRQRRRADAGGDGSVVTSSSRNLIPAGDDPVSSSSSSRKASSLLLTAERELSVVQESLVRERNARRLDTLKFRQGEERLQRQVQFLLEETEQSRTLLDEVRSRSERDAAQLDSALQTALQDLRRAERTTEELRDDRAGADTASDEAVFWRRTSEHHARKAEAAAEENRRLRESLAQQRPRPSAPDAADVTITPRKDDARDRAPALSPAPDAIMTELHRTRVEASDAQRRCRMQSRKAEDSEARLKAARPKLERLKTCQDSIVKLKHELDTIRQEKEINRASESQWQRFRREVRSTPLLWGQDHEDADHDDDHDDAHPPEIATVVRRFRTLSHQLSTAQEALALAGTQLAGCKDRIAAHDQELREQQGAVTTLRKEKKLLEERLLDSTMETRRCKAQEAVWKREAEGMRTIVDTVGNSLPGSSADHNRNAPAAELRLASALEHVEASSQACDEMKQEFDRIVEEKRSAEEELERVKDKFGKIREALMKERAKAEEAEDRACRAETLAGKGAYNEDTTRVVHLQDNPLSTAIREKYEKEIAELRHEMEAGGTSDPKGTPGSRGSSSSEAAVVDVQKATQRLKDKFKEHISLFREAVYLLTGYKVDMTVDVDRPYFKVRSMYAEKEDDHLMFIWPQKLSSEKQDAVTSLDLVDSPLAQTLSSSVSFSYLTKYKSIPAFMGSLTLALFEAQTFMG